MFLIFEFRFELLITFPFSIILTVICFNLSVFYSFGKEKIHIEKSKLIIERINQPIKSKTRRIELIKIEKVSILNKGEKNLLPKNLELQDYALEFNKTGKIELKLKSFETIKILNGVDSEEAKTIKYWIEMKIKELNIER